MTSIEKPEQAAREIATLLRKLNDEGLIFFGILKATQASDPAYAYIEVFPDGSVMYQKAEDP